MHPDRKRIEELRKLALASDAATATAAELARRGIESHLGSTMPDWRSELADDDRRVLHEAQAAHREAMKVIAFVHWRVGRTNACNVYAVTGVADNWKDDTPIATFITPELAIQCCDDHNHRLDARVVR